MLNNVSFFTFEQIHGKSNIGSTRIRADWLIKYWPKAERFKIGKKYDVLILQKAYLTEYAEMFDGIKILDICDPDHLDFHPLIKMINKCDAVTVSSPELYNLVKNWTNNIVRHIPDRIDLVYNKQKKIHKGKAKSVVWFGYSHNEHCLSNAIPYLDKLGLKLTVISEEMTALCDYGFEEYKDKLSWKKFNIDTLNDEIIKHDFVVMPPSMKYRDRYKSNNKTVHSWSIGMPVANNYEDLVRFMNPKERIKEAEVRLKEVKEKYDVKLSVKEYRELINEISSRTKASKVSEKSKS